MNFCLGTVQFGIDYGIQGNKKPGQTEVNDMIHTAMKNNIVYFDTASAYGDAESVLGEYLRSYPNAKQEMHIISKLNPRAFENGNVEEWKKIAVQEAERSLKCIGVSQFYAYLFHNAEYIYDKSAVSALSEVKKSNLAQKIGVSVYTPEEAMKALEYPEIEAIQIPYNVFDRRLDKVNFFQKAKERNVVVFARSSLLQGFVMMNPEQLPSKVLFAKNYLVDYLNICSKYKCSPLKVAIGYVAQKRGIDYVVFGVDCLSQLEEYISISDFKLSDEMVMELNQTFENVEEKLVNPSMWKG